MSKLLPILFIILIAIIVLNGCDQSSTAVEPIELKTDSAVEVANLTAEIVDETQILLNWKDNASAEIGFEIFERSGSEGDFIPLVKTEANVITFLIDKHRRAFDYYYKVRAINVDGNSGFSNAARVVGFQLAGVVPGSGHLHDIEFSPDGTLIAVAGEFTSAFGDGGVAIAEANGGGIVSILETERNHGYMIARCTRFSPDGQQLAVGTNTGRLEIWDVQSWELQRTYLEEMEINWFSGVRSIDFSPSYKYLTAIISSIDRIMVWEYGSPLTNERIIDLGEQFRDIHVRISHDDQYLAVLGFVPPSGEIPILSIFAQVIW